MRVAIVVMDQMRAFDVAAAAETFTSGRADGAPHHEVVVVAGAGEVMLDHGVRVEAAPLRRGEGADLVVVPGLTDRATLLGTDEADVLTSWVLAQHTAGARVASLCTGAFLLAQTGLLDGQQATTHWRACDELARRHPRIDVRPDVIAARAHDGMVWTSAGVTAGIDLCLTVIAEAHGAAAAAAAARAMVLPTHRDGGQAQYVPPRHREGELNGSRLADLCQAVRADLAEPWSLRDLADRAGLSVRTLHRWFVEDLGAAPARWVAQERVTAARELLETTDLTVEQVATRVGFAGGDVLRKHVRATLGVAPSRYRRSFGPHGGGLA